MKLASLMRSQQKLPHAEDEPQGEGGERRPRSSRNNGATLIGSVATLCVAFVSARSRPDGGGELSDTKGARTRSAARICEPVTSLRATSR